MFNFAVSPYFFKIIQMKLILISLLAILPFFGFSKNNTMVSSASDYFRSKQNGAWNDVNTWQSSTDSIIWVNASLTPTATSTSVTIKDSVFLTIGLPIDDLYINNGGVLVNTITSAGNNFNILINLLTPYSFIIKNGGTYLVTSLVTFGSNTTLAGKTLIQTGGRIKIGNGVNNVGTLNHTYGISNTIDWQDDAIFEWNTPSTLIASNLTFFINSYSSYTTPILLFSYSVPIAIGGSSSFFVHGRLEATAPITFTGTGTKTFRGGIVNNAIITFNLGKVVLENDLINVCKLGGNSDIIVNAGMDITGATTSQFELNVTGSKTIVGNINLLNRALINLNNNIISVNGNITGGSGDPNLRYFNCNGTGALKIINVGNSSVTFPIGSAYGADDIYDPVTIVNNGTVDNFTVNVTQQFPSCLTLAQRQNSVETTWNITEDVTGGSNVQLTLVYGDGLIISNTGPSYSALSAKIVHCGATVADYANGSVNNLTVTGTGNGFTSFSPFGITSDAALLTYLPTQLQAFSATPFQTNNSKLNWKLSAETNIKNFTIQRSQNGTNFIDLQTINVNNTNNYEFIDFQNLIGINYYRLKINTKEEGAKFSTIQKVQFLNNDLYFSALYPTITKSTITMDIFSKKQENAYLYLIDNNANVVLQKNIYLQKGITNKIIDVQKLSKGIHYLKLITTGNSIIQKIIKE